ncbi:hypothetical protein K4F52_007317 [Lecanicillium sp. MT-2017a]|nr:hypothetical protein K4F52_007317 [Lecanicillium sp. MT-2017a]
MKLSIAVITSLIATASAKSYGLGFENLKAGKIPSQGLSKLGASPPPESFKEIKYSASWNVVNMKSPLVPDFKPRSGPNVMLNSATPDSDLIGLTRLDTTNAESVTYKQFYAACLTEIRGKVVPVSCEILTLAKGTDEEYKRFRFNYKASNKMQVVKLPQPDFSERLSLSFFLESSDAAKDATVYFALDNFLYTTHPKK